MPIDHLSLCLLYLLFSELFGHVICSLICLWGILTYFNVFCLDEVFLILGSQRALESPPVPYQYTDHLGASVSMYV